MKHTPKSSTKKTGQEADKEDGSLLKPPVGAIEILEKHSCLDLRIARLTLGLYETIYATTPNFLFPGYRWEQRDVNDLPAELREHGQGLLLWGQVRCPWLNELVASKTRIEASVSSRRGCSPNGKKWAEVAESIRGRYPPIAGGSRNPFRPGEPTTMAIDLLPQMIGRPLSERTLRLIQSFSPASVKISRHDDPWLFNEEPRVIAVRLNPDRFSVQSIVIFVPAPSPVLSAREIAGELEDYSETGTEGVVWALTDDENFGYHALHIIEGGDHLTITDQLGSELWSGVIRCDRRAGRRRRPLNPKFMQPSALGYWVHWTQHGFKPDDWAQFFIRPEFDRLRGVLIKKVAAKPTATGGPS